MRSRYTSLTGHTQPITARLASVPAVVHWWFPGSTDATVRAWTATDGKPGISINAGAPVTSLAVSTDGKLVAVGCQDKLVKIFQLADGKLIATHTGHTQPINAVAWNSKNSRVASAANDGLLRVWDPATGQLLETLSAARHCSRPAWPSSHPMNCMLAIGWSDGQSAIERLRLNWSIAAATGAVTSVAFTPDGAGLLTGGADKKVQLWNTLDGKPVRAFAGATDVVTAVACSCRGRDGKLFWPAESIRRFASGILPMPLLSPL